MSKLPIGLINSALDEHQPTTLEMHSKGPDPGAPEMPEYLKVLENHVCPR